MPCGMPIDDLIARMKARGVPGSAEAEKIFEEMRSPVAPESAEAEEQQEPIEKTASERITT